MANDWQGYALAEGFTVDGSAIGVSFADGRRQLVNVSEGVEEYRLSSFVVKQAKAESISDLPLQVWKRNRSTAIVGFRIDDRGRLVGEAWVPKLGMTAEEFQLTVRTVAAECDRWEFILTGRDNE